MRKHTSINLDIDLLQRAADSLGTKGISRTVHAALSDVVRRRRRMAILELDPAIDLVDLDSMRASRFLDDRA